MCCKGHVRVTKFPDPPETALNEHQALTPTARTPSVDTLHGHGERASKSHMAGSSPQLAAMPTSSTSNRLGLLNWGMLNIFLKMCVYNCIYIYIALQLINALIYTHLSQSARVVGGPPRMNENSDKLLCI